MLRKAEGQEFESVKKCVKLFFETVEVNNIPPSAALNAAVNFICLMLVNFPEKDFIQLWESILPAWRKIKDATGDD